LRKASADPRLYQRGTRESAVKAERAQVPQPPFWGVRTLDRIDLGELWACFDLRSLYRLSWGAANTKGDAFERLVAEEFEPRLARYQAEAIGGACSSRRWCTATSPRPV